MQKLNAMYDFAYGNIPLPSPHQKARTDEIYCGNWQNMNTDCTLVNRTLSMFNFLNCTDIIKDNHLVLKKYTEK